MKAKTRNELLTECACFDLRRATRAVSRMYDDFLRDAGLNITQFSLLRLICVEKELSISTLGRYMVMDRTSITRALAPLERVVESAEPKWRQAQEALMDTIGEDRWRAMCTVLRDTTRMVRHRTITAD